MEITKKSLVDLIKQINEFVCNLKAESAIKDKHIKELKAQNQELKESNLATLDQIKKYIKELEQIKSHYVDSNNNSE